jgi:peptidoglycan/xylan/chitin deacetylase (PgdA/CDA1 family)
LERNGLTREENYLAKAVLARFPRSLKRARGRVVVLCYHSVHPTYEFASATPAQFDEQVGWLKDHCEIIQLSEVLDRIKQARASSRPAVAITFDDGYEDNFFHALPPLLRHGVKASFFVTTGLIDRIPSALDHMRRIRKMNVTGLTWEQVSELRQAGMQIGSHTINHARLTKLDDQAALTELTDSKRAIEDRLSEDVSSLAYPYGIPGRDVTDRTIALALRAGYETAVSILYRGVRESDHAMSIPRIAVKNNSTRMLRGKVVGSLDIIGRWQARANRGAPG